MLCSATNTSQFRSTLIYLLSVLNILVPVVLYECETWSLSLREQRQLRVFENKVLRRVFGPKRDGLTGGWRLLHNEELHN
jgi:hypothetical protein